MWASRIHVICKGSSNLSSNHGINYTNLMPFIPSLEVVNMHAIVVMQMARKSRVFIGQMEELIVNL
uniref:AlNc14C96G5887 protein n=1 Tax=Albugo laibachii Nc14 TaxID=890382 RepID=F0WH12_9STRA|nr:AlNc14C96G5887 [Albugo laibachii Nc14]|eukprot:CCA20527.1 AlNc14C96G5887 [Albugo laibachii Nc14]